MYRFMDKQEIEINQIDNLKMIHIYDLALAGGAASQDKIKAGTGKNHVPAFAVYYGDNKQINLCVMDRFYNLLMERVLYLYSKCEEKNLIIVDEQTRKLLELACQGVDNGVSSVARTGKKYMNMTSHMIPEFNSESHIRKTMIPMIKYYLKELYSLWDMELNFKDGESGWHGNVVLMGTSHNKDIKFPVVINNSGVGRYSVLVGNFIEEKSNIRIDIEYKKQSLLINFNSEDYLLVGDSRYDFSLGEPACITNIKVNRTLVYCNNETVEKLSGDICLEVPLKNIFDLTASDTNIYKLPWSAYYMSSIKLTEHEDIRHSDYDTGFIEQNNNAIFSRQYAWSDIVNTNTGVSISSGGGSMERIIPDLSKGTMQTLFLPVGYYSGWDYKEKLENRYFYEDIKE